MVDIYIEIENWLFNALFLFFFVVVVAYLFNILHTVLSSTLWLFVLLLLLLLASSSITTLSFLDRFYLYPVFLFQFNLSRNMDVVSSRKKATGQCNRHRSFSALDLTLLRLNIALFKILTF